MITEEVMSITRNARPPVQGFYFKTVDRLTHVAVVVYRDNFTSMKETEQNIIGQWLGLQVISKIRALGIPCYLEVADTFGGKTV